MHIRRRWCVSAVATAEELAEKLTQHTWTLCTGFFVPTHPRYLFLNDATHEDGAGEYGVVSGGLDGPPLSRPRRPLFCRRLSSRAQALSGFGVCND